jgi:hypothetical protein
MVFMMSQIPRIQYTYETELGLNKNYSKADSLHYVSEVFHVHGSLNKELLYGSYLLSLL